MAFKTFFGKKEEEEKQQKEKQQQQQVKQPLYREVKPEVKTEIKADAKTGTTPQIRTDEPPVAVQLENAMIENGRQDTKENRSKVYQELLFSDLLLALVDAPQITQPENPDSPQNLNVAIMSNPQGVQFAAAFTSADAAKLWRVEGGQYVSIRGQEIFKLLEPSPAEVIVINAGSAPFITLTKAEYSSLAQGIVPQTAKSPVQAATAPGANQQEAGMQISFPPDAFTEQQKTVVEEFLKNTPNIEAAALGALLPPNAPNPNDWLRTIFLRTKQVQKDQAEVQKYCIDIRDKLMKSSEHFAALQFEVGIMPDNNFWVAINQNKFTLFDKNPPSPPKAPPVVNTPGIRKA